MATGGLWDGFRHHFSGDPQQDSQIRFFIHKNTLLKPKFWPLFEMQSIKRKTSYFSREIEGFFASSRDFLSLTNALVSSILLPR